MRRSRVLSIRFLGLIFLGLFVAYSRPVEWSNRPESASFTSPGHLRNVRSFQAVKASSLAGGRAIRHRVSAPVAPTLVTILAGTLLLLPFGLSTIRFIDL